MTSPLKELRRAEAAPPELKSSGTGWHRQARCASVLVASDRYGDVVPHWFEHVEEQRFRLSGGAQAKPRIEPVRPLRRCGTPETRTIIWQRGDGQRLAPTIAAVYLDNCVKFRGRSCDGELHAFAIWCIDDLHDTVGKSSAHGNGSRCVVERALTKSEAIRRIGRIGQRRLRGHVGRCEPQRRHQARPCRWNRTP
jgi:hypothetical protein